MTRVLIVDDHEFFRGVLVDLVNASDDLEAVGECSDGDQVVDAVATLAPDVVLMDLRMPHMSGVDAAGALQREGSTARVIVLTSETADSCRRAARAKGAAGFLLKGDDFDLVLEAVRHVAAGGSLWADEMPAPQTCAR